MKAVRFVAAGVILAAWTVAIYPAKAKGQTSNDPTWREVAPGRVEWEQRALRRSGTGPSRYAPPMIASNRPADRWSPNRRTYATAMAAGPGTEGPLAPIAADQLPQGQEVIPTPEPIGSEPVPQEEQELAPGMGRPGTLWEGPDPWDRCDGACGPGGCWEGECGPFGGYYGGCVVDWLKGFTFFAGIHGFKGPVDAGQNGNFGFHEGLNYGGPLGDPWGFGYQVGFQAVHSNFSGFQTDPDGGGRLDVTGRDQQFLTGGVFRRAECGGLQGGVVFDFMHDNYFDKADLRQIRSETSLVFPDLLSEIGYFGAYGVNRERFRIDPNDPTAFLVFRPNDVFAAFYRRHFTGGGQGRLWAGATGAGQAIIGGEATVPLGTSWALENNFVYVIPKSSAEAGGQREETWSVSINLVWYPGRPARCVFKDPFQPLFGVGDNSAFLVRRGPGPVR